MPGQDPFIGTKLGSYKILAAIGEGGMARIYKGFHADLKRYAAIKVVNWGLQEDPEVTARFRREAQAIASLRHPNIVQIFDFGKYDNGYFMVMEFIDGSDLANQLRQYRAEQKLLPKDRLIKIINDVAAALDYAHSREVIHRDVKPSNIMITKEGQSILTDFGLVMLPAKQSQVTIGNTFGTPHYVAPEQAISSAAAVTTSDVYSLGVILYEAATGQLPFDDESPLSVALKHVSDLPTPPRAINPELPRPVEEVILKTLAKQPADRFATAGEMAVTLAVAWSDAATAARRGSLAPVLPTGVPPVAEVSKITLPNSAAVAPIPVEGEATDAVRPSKRGSSRGGWLAFGWWPWAFASGLLALLIALVWFINNFSFQPAPTPVAPAVADAARVAPEQVLTLPTTTPTSEPPTHTPTTKPTVTALPTETATAEPTATFALTPTASLTSSPTPEPTPTPAPTPSPTSTPVPRPTPTPPGPLSREQLRGKILFKTDRSGTVEIYRMDADGSNQLPLPPEDWEIYTRLEAELPFSANKEEQIVVRGEGQLDLWRSNLVGGQELRVTSTGKAEYDAAWSPVDNRIAYVSEETGNGDIYLLNLDGSAITRLTDNVDDFDKHPTWSPDGTKIAFWSDMGFNKTRQIWVIDLQTTVLTSLSDNPFNDWDPVWVP